MFSRLGRPLQAPYQLIADVRMPEQFHVTHAMRNPLFVLRKRQRAMRVFMPGVPSTNLALSAPYVAGQAALSAPA